MAKQQQITWKLGMTNVPGDAVCDDNMLEGEVNMVYRDGEHKPIQDMKQVLTMEETDSLLYVHKYNNYLHYIASDGENLYWYDEDGTRSESIGTAGTDADITSIGNTMIVNVDGEIGYYLWKPVDGNYSYLGDKIPEIDIKFGMTNGGYYNSDSVSLDGMISDSSVVATEQDTFNDAMVGMYASGKQKWAENGGFCNPFFVRYALELFDGSYTNMSVPILMLPSVTRNNFLVQKNTTGEYQIRVAGGHLCYWSEHDLSEWKDIVKDVVVFVTDEIDVCDTDTNQSYTPSAGADQTTDCVGIGQATIIQNMPYETYKSQFHSITWETSSTTGTRNYTLRQGIVSKSKNSITGSVDLSTLISDLKNQTIFYRIASLGTKNPNYYITTYCWGNVNIKGSDLKNLTTLEKLEDDYYSHCTLGANLMYVYNGRLNLANVRRGFWEGGSSFLPLDNSDTSTTTLYIYIKTNEGLKIVKKEISGNEKIGMYYFFYPDPRAYKVMFVNSSGYYVEKDLEEHPYLNGAYYIESLPTSKDVNDATMFDGITSILSDVPTVDTTPERLQNQIWTSEVNNPFVFTAEGNNTIGTGVIIGLASLTTALSQGQFGEYPLICFTSDGIWALQTSTEGLYSSAHPMSREVCNNADSITQTDGAVFFTSEKGLMVIVGNEVKCVSEQMKGKSVTLSGEIYETISSMLGGTETRLSLNEYLEGAKIAYDYRDSMLWITRSDKEFAWIYSIKSGTLALKTLSKSITSVVNNYPDTLFQMSDARIYSLMERSIVNEDNNVYTCYLISRPMKLENGVAWKTIERMKTISDGDIGVKIYASNDLKQWYRVNSLHGRGFKYWKIAYKLTNMSATSVFDGVLLRTSERYTGRFR